MAVSLASLKRGRNVRPPRIVIYGPHGLGKSSFGASAPAPVFIQTEDGLGTLDVTSFPLAQTFADVNGALSTLYTDDHEFSTVVIDSADWLEPLIWKETCALHGKADIEEFGYGKGYGFALDQWRSVLSGLNALRDTKNMASIVTAHCQIKRFDSPEVEPYDRYTPKLHNSASALLQEWADAVFFTNWKTVIQKEDVGFNKKVARGVTTGQRMMYTTEKPAYLAKNRYSLPEEMDLSWQAFADALTASAAQT